MDIVTTLLAARPGESWSLDGNSYEGLVWHSDTPKPTLEELEEAWPTAENNVKWAEVRRERDKRLAACDWTQVADAPVDAAAWAVYRQALRDVPQQFADPDAVVWPTAP